MKTDFGKTLILHLAMNVITMYCGVFYNVSYINATDYHDLIQNLFKIKYLKLFKIITEEAHQFLHNHLNRVLVYMHL